MKKLIYFLILTIGFVNCKNLGLGTEKEKDYYDKNTETLLLLDNLNKSSEFLEINGKWKDNFNSYHQIFGIKSNSLGTKGFWEDFVIRIIVEFDNSSRTLYVKGINEQSWADCDGDSTKGEQGVECYSRIVWTKYDDSYYYCEIVYNKGSLEEAKNDPKTADASDPNSSGCGNFPWTKFVQKLD